MYIQVYLYIFIYLYMDVCIHTCSQVHTSHCNHSHDKTEKSSTRSVRLIEEAVERARQMVRVDSEKVWKYLQINV
jgi:hypothetical protein